VAAAAEQSRSAELQAEEEQQEDDPELRDEVRHLRRLNQAQHLWLVRSEQEAREQVGRDGGEPETTGNQPERRQQSNRHRKLAECHSPRLILRPFSSRPQASSASFGRLCQFLSVRDIRKLRRFRVPRPLISDGLAS